MENQPSKLVPALIGGGVMAVLSTIPIINMGNCLCCMWVLLGGALAVWFYQKDLPAGEPMTSGDGAILGLMAGVFGALFGTLLSTFFMALGDGMPMQDIMENIHRYNADIGPEVEDFLDTLGEGGAFSPVFILFGLLMSLIVDSIFGLLGGVIGVAIFKKKQLKAPAGNDNSTL